MKWRNFPRLGNEGLTLIELVVAVVILTFGVIATMAVLVHAESATDGTRAKTMALSAAQEQLEIIMRDAPSNVTNWNAFAFPVGDLIGPAGGLPGLVTVTPTLPRTVTVTVAWQGQGTLPAGQVTITALRCEANR